MPATPVVELRFIAAVRERCNFAKLLRVMYNSGRWWRAGALDFDDQVWVKVPIFPGLAASPGTVPFRVADDAGGAHAEVPALVCVPVHPEVRALDRMTA